MKTVVFDKTGTLLQLVEKFGSAKHVMETKDFGVHTGGSFSGRVGDKMVLVLRLTSMFQNMRIWLERVCWLP